MFAETVMPMRFKILAIEALTPRKAWKSAGEPRRVPGTNSARGTGPSGITTTPEGRVFFASLAGNYLGRIDIETGTTTVLEPPVPRAWRVWSDSRGGLWITGWNSGDLLRYDSTNDSCQRWHLPGDRPQPYTVYVDDTDAVWVSDWGANAILSFDPKTERSYGAGGDGMATSSLHFLEGVPRCPSRMT
jgi:streptogramin lyase